MKRDWESLGTAIVPSGVVVIVDAGLLGSWSQKRFRPKITRALAANQAAQVTFGSVSCVACGGLPTDQPFKICGKQVTGEFEGYWEDVWLEVMPGRVTRSERVGNVVVECARLMFADLDALGAWKHSEPLDGLADFVLWGEDAEAVAVRHGAPRLGEDEFGWRNLDADEAMERGREIAAEEKKGKLLFTTDYRPHSHHELLMSQIRSAPTSSGVVKIGDAQLCGFHTTWGDGTYPVYRDMDDHGRLVRLRIKFSTDN